MRTKCYYYVATIALFSLIACKKRLPRPVILALDLNRTQKSRRVRRRKRIENLAWGEFSL